jgi:hypothetical protein
MEECVDRTCIPFVPVGRLSDLTRQLVAVMFHLVWFALLHNSWLRVGARSDVGTRLRNTILLRRIDRSRRRGPTCQVLRLRMVATSFQKVLYAIVLIITELGSSRRTLQFVRRISVCPKCCMCSFVFILHPLTPASAMIAGTFNQQNSNLLAIKVDVDCDTLLQNMVQEASKVVAKVVELTNSAWTNASKANTSTETHQLESVDSNKIVSPDLRANLPTKRPLPLIPLDLDNHTHHFDLVNGVVLGNPIHDDPESSELDLPISAENASAIVDFVISEIDTDTIMPPAFKKHRTLESS